MGTFIKKLIEINEGLTSYQNITSNFNISDKTPLQLIQIYKKTIDYLNQELKEIYGKEHADFFLVCEDLKARINTVKIDIDDINEYFNNKINFNQLKNNLVKNFTKLYKVANVEDKENYIKNIRDKLLPKINISFYNKKSPEINLFNIELSKTNNFNDFMFFLHDFVLHTSLDNNVIYKFNLKDEEGKSLYLPLKPKPENISKSPKAKKYSPEEVLHELYSLLSLFFTRDLIIHDSLVTKLDPDKLNILLSQDDPIERKIMNKATLISLKANIFFSKKEIQFLIKKINSADNKNIKHLNENNVKILYSILNQMENRFDSKNYKIDSIDFLKNTDYFTEDSTFKDLKEYFRDYPNFLKIFKNFDDKQKIFELNEDDSRKLKNLLSRSIPVLNSLLKNNEKNIEERLPKINFLIKRIGQLIDNTRSDNFISILSKELN